MTDKVSITDLSEKDRNISLGMAEIRLGLQELRRILNSFNEPPDKDLDDAYHFVGYGFNLIAQEMEYEEPFFKTALDKPA